MRSKIVAAVFLGFVFTVGSFAHAQSSADLRAQLQALLSQVAALQQLLAQSQANTSYPTAPIVTNPTGGTCPALYRALRRGVSGEDVMELQQFLFGRGFLHATPSGFFGALTEEAVQRFQAQHGVVSGGTPDTTGYGAVGPGTRASIAELCRSVTPSYPPPFTPTTPYPFPPISQSCTVNGVTVQNGATQILYASPTVPAGQPCSGAIRSCSNGFLSGSTSYIYPSCSQPSARTCYLDGSVIPENVTQTYYSRREVSHNESCTTYAQQRACTQGSLSGSPSYVYFSCAREEARNCFYEGEEIVHGSSRTFYSATHIPFGSSCASYATTRHCTDGVLSGSTSHIRLSCSPALSASCTLDGKTVTNNTTGDFYSAGTVPFGGTCASITQSRSCTNGILSGSDSYNRASCTVAGPGACALDGISVAHNASRTFYSSSTVPYSQSCTTLTLSRSCSNGSLSGSDAYNRASCTVSAPRPCTLDGATVSHDALKTFYSADSVAHGQQCASISASRACSNGVLSGSASHDKAVCSVRSPSACALDGVSVSHGASRVYYFAEHIPSNELCSSYGVSRTCTNGVLSGSSAYTHAMCAPVAGNNCALDNELVPNGSSTLFYSLKTAPNGQLCSAYQQSRACTNGALSGGATYFYATCTNSTPCTLDGKTVHHGTSTLFYSARTVPFGTTCASVSHARTCTNGVLGGTATFAYASCSVSPPVSASPLVHQLASALTALEAYLRSLSDNL